MRIQPAVSTPSSALEPSTSTEVERAETAPPPTYLETDSSDFEASPPELPEDLQTLVRSASPADRAMAVASLRHGRPEALAALTELSTDPVWYVRRAVVDALLPQGKAAVPVLKNMRDVEGEKSVAEARSFGPDGLQCPLS